MYPDDRVLVGVMNRKRDFIVARDEHWYRIPQNKMPRGVYVEYLAFFLSGNVFDEQSGGIHFYAPRRGLELRYRKDLLPKEVHHARANDVYFQVQLGELIPKDPPILNKTNRNISFIYTTWDRFVHAQDVRDLYSDSDYYVDRIFHALKDARIRPERYWDVERRTTGNGAQLRILCENGTVVVSPEKLDDALYLDMAEKDAAILARIKAAIAEKGGPVTISIPYQGFF